MTPAEAGRWAARRSIEERKTKVPIINQNMKDDNELLTPGIGKKDWMKEWIGMPDFEMKNLQSWQSVIVHFENEQDRQAFAKFVGQTLTYKTKSIWYPKAKIGHFAGTSWESRLPHHQKVPRYPIYIPSKGRWKSRKTVRALDEIGVKYHVVVEPQEYDDYASVIAPEKILQLPKENYGKGCSIPARNWIWNHSRKHGFKRHWVIDDNIEGFFRLTNNLKTPVSDGITFRAAEEFTDRYENVAMSGFNYFMFAPRKSGDINPYTLNTRIYSCILLSNTARNSDGEFYAWRGRYNEDTDLSLRILKDGFCTVLFNAFLAFKSTTMTMEGGNTESLYQIKDGRKKMAESLKEQHPGLVKISFKWGRWQHHVDYSGFVQRLKPKPDLDRQKIDLNHSMNLKVVGKKRSKE